MTDWGKILSQAEINNAMRERKKTYLEKTTWRSSLEDEKTIKYYEELVKHLGSSSRYQLLGVVRITVCK